MLARNQGRNGRRRGGARADASRLEPARTEVSARRSRTQKWVFVTGTPRSGTTFAGRMLSIPIEVDYLHEPFNPQCGAPGIDRFYLYLNGREPASSPYRDVVRDVMAGQFSPRTSLYRQDSTWRYRLRQAIGSRSTWALRRAKLNPFHTTMVIKDPIGCLLTEYLHEHYGAQPLILIRHPVAVIASIIRLGWHMDLAPIRQQPRLVEDHFADDGDFLRQPRSNEIQSAAALWRALNKVLLKQASRHPSWTVLPHETLSQDTGCHFRRLYAHLGLPWTDRVAARIGQMTGAGNPVEAADRNHDQLKRDSRALVWRGLNQLSKAERRKVYEITGDVASAIYSEDSFLLDGDDAPFANVHSSKPLFAIGRQTH